ncbi:DUF4919 domain-containing protein [uncultured Maribacter sp.]|uniref:DUF4919 domain-containing protein n=1 Tax=uncultured Maribacter sp. TaxID=431308 RepID=UPI00262EB661|nr:DUF4919 domain-containing protein [uncultured Maribacter sp.]
MKKIVLVILSLYGLQLHSQDWNFEKPDYKAIEKNIAEQSSNLFYPNLMDRFLKADSTLTLKEKRHLYYGYSFQENYSPYSRSDFADSLRVILQLKTHDILAFKKIITFGDSVLVKNPFALRTLNYQLYALDKTDNIRGYRKKMKQFNMIIDALLSSGNGTTKEESFYVIYTSHEYDLLNILGLTFGGSQSLIEHYDYLELAEGETKIKGLYFDVTPCLNYMSKIYK